MSVPKGVNPESVTSTLSPEGVLTILAPKMCLEGKVVNNYLLQHSLANGKPFFFIIRLERARDSHYDGSIGWFVQHSQAPLKNWK